MPDQIVRDTADLSRILHRIHIGHQSHLGWRWKWHIETLTTPQRQGWIIKLSFERRCFSTGTIGRGTGREWVVWSGITDTGVLKTAWCAFQAIIIHEAMHAFTVDGKALFDPHAEASDLLSISEKPRADDYGMWQPTTTGLPDADSFRRHLKNATKIIRSWPAWKQGLLGY